MSRPASPTRHIRVPSVTTHTAMTTTPTPVMASPTQVPESDTSPPDTLLRLRYCHFQQKQNIPSHDLCPQCNIMIPPHKLFPSNYIRTTKYTLWTFLPKNLMEQFMKIANFYFLIVAILSLTPLSPKTPIVSIAPLIFVLSVTGIKEAYEDYQRYRIDVETNSSLVQCWRNGTWQRIRWMDVVFGDLVRIESEHYFPADLVLLQSSSPQGTCSIETANLDGETNLKIKQAVPATYEIITDQDDGRDYPHKFVGILESDAPNDKMDAAAWKGNFISIPGAAPKVPLSMTQLLLRGCRLRNTAWIIGIVCFTGFDTKLMLQNKGKEIKRSHVDKTVDRALYVIFCIQATVCTFGAIAQSVWLNSHDHLWYLPFHFNINSESAQSFLTYLVLVDILVPISLYVSMELVKFAQAFYINVDIQMYYAPANIPAKARTSNLNEELGQIDYIFSDKTGTLTRNEMKFYRCTVGKEPYGPGCMAESKQQIERAPPCKGIPPFKPDYMFEDNRLYHRLCNGLPADRHLINEFLTMLCVCHTVMPSFPGCISNHMHARDGCDVECEYHAQSPDELALVEAALSQQYYFHHLTPMKFQYRGFEIEGNRMTVNIQGEHHHFDLFEVLEFNSTRKRMSVIVLDHRDNQLKLYCKGADNVIRERMTSTSIADMWDATNRHLQSFAKVGLRTLCCAYRVLDGPTFDTWWRSHLIAKSSMENRSEMVASSYDEIEVELTLLGTTAIEDRLQEGVPETIYKLKKAGIKIWVLTGDKVETAINIGRSCRLLTDLMRGDHLIVMDVDESLDDTEARIQTLECLDAAEHSLQQHKHNQTLENVGIVISGKALGFIFPRRLLDKKKREIIPPPHILQQEHQLQLRFLALCSDVSAVICCRMSPKQKSQVVRLVKENYKDKITLAIGDGANDVAMIEAAHVGVGIEGLEGKQAVMASDYSIGQFAYLQRLLLVHGAWSYRRLSTLILYSFYKNVTCSMTQIWFAIFSGYSAQLFFDAYSGALFNLLFTSLPVLACAIFNRDISAETMLAFPKLYACGRHREVFNMRTLFAWIFKGMCDSVLVFFFTIHIMSSMGNEDGHDNDHWVMSTAMFTTIVVMVNIKIGFETTTWVKVIYRLVRQATFWLLIAIGTAIAMIPDVLWRFIRTHYFPLTVDLGMYHFPFLVADQQADEAFEADTARQVQAQLLQMATMEAEQQRIAAEQQSYHQSQSQSQPTHMQMPFVRNKLVGTNSLSSMRSGDDILIHDADGTRKLSSWQQLAQQRNEQNLGYTPWIESEGESSHVMGAARFVQVNVNARTTPQWQTRHIKDPYERKN